jgi:hypothetical protein
VTRNGWRIAVSGLGKRNQEHRWLLFGDNRIFGDPDQKIAETPPQFSQFDTRSDVLDVLIQLDDQPVNVLPLEGSVTALLPLTVHLKGQDQSVDHHQQFDKHGRPVLLPNGTGN